MSEFHCAFCGKPSTYTPEVEGETPPDNMICDACFEAENAANEQQEKMAAYYNEQHRIRYQHARIFDNEVGTVSATYKRKVLRVWNYNVFGHLDVPSQIAAKNEAKWYLEGCLDTIEAYNRSKQK
jgi:hypothetical protein